MRPSGATPRERDVRPAAPQPSAMTLEQADFVCAYGVTVAAGDDRTAEQWARDLWEGASPPLRWFMIAGWRLVLGLRLGPRPSPSHILGWPVVECRPDATVCQLRSRFLNACNEFQLIDGSLVWSTLVAYDRPIARFIWLPVSVIHRPLVRRALHRAARTS